MHNASMKSLRMQKLLTYLKSVHRAGATTADIADWTKSKAPGTDVSALRRNGFKIRCEYQYQTADGGKVFAYFYEGKT